MQFVCGGVGCDIKGCCSVAGDETGVGSRGSNHSGVGEW